jgi:glycosyltransferase involved in cell wall biosynthesis
VLLADSEATMRDLHDFYPRSRGKVRVAYPGAPTVLPTTSQQITAVCTRIGVQPGKYFLHLGTQQPRKNLRRLIDAYAIARAHLPTEYQLVIAGGAGWGGENLTAHAMRTGVRESVVFTGYVSDEDKAALLHGARALIFPSLHEGFGFPVLEAQIAGVPVACSNTSSLPEAAGDGARTFDPLRTNDIAAAILDVALDDLLRTRLIERGSHNTARFTWDACAHTALQALTGASA